MNKAYSDYKTDLSNMTCLTSQMSELWFRRDPASIYKEERDQRRQPVSTSDLHIHAHAPAHSSVPTYEHTPTHRNIFNLCMIILLKQSLSRDFRGINIISQALSRCPHVTQWSSIMWSNTLLRL